MTTPYTPDQNTIARLANAFSRILREGMTPDEMALIIVRNTNEPNPQICHSHDFCDANIPMWHAWAETFDGWTAYSTADCDDVCTHNTLNGAHYALWCAAWDAAKRASFEPLPFDEAIEPIMPPGDDAFDAREPEQDPIGEQFRTETLRQSLLLADPPSPEPTPDTPPGKLERRRERIVRFVGYKGFSVTYLDVQTNCQAAILAPHPAALESMWKRLGVCDRAGKPLLIDMGLVQETMIVEG